MSDDSTGESIYKYLQCKSEWNPSFHGMDQTIVTIKIGLEARKFHVHLELLCEASPYFQAAFEGEFVEAQARIITLHDISVKTFEIVQTWLYSGTLILPDNSAYYLDPTHKDGDKCPECGVYPTNTGTTVWWGNDLLDIYVLADKYNFPLLRRETMINFQHLDEINNSWPGLKLACEVFERLPNTSPLCKYVVDMFKHWWHPTEKLCPCCQPQEIEYFTAENMPRSLMFEVMRASHQLNKDPTFKTAEMVWCDYHEHKNKEEAGACRVRRKLEGRYGDYEYLDDDE